MDDVGNVAKCKTLHFPINASGNTIISDFDQKYHFLKNNPFKFRGATESPPYYYSQIHF